MIKEEIANYVLQTLECEPEQIDELLNRLNSEDIVENE